MMLDRRCPMKRYLLTAFLTAVPVTPALADDVYVTFNIVYGVCQLADEKPNEIEDEMQPLLGQYSSKEEAEKAMNTLPQCAYARVVWDRQTRLCEVKLPFETLSMGDAGRYEDIAHYHDMGEAERAVNTLEQCKHHN